MSNKMLIPNIILSSKILVKVCNEATISHNAKSLTDSLWMDESETVWCIICSPKEEYVLIFFQDCMKSFTGNVITIAFTSCISNRDVIKFITNIGFTKLFKDIVSTSMELILNLRSIYIKFANESYNLKSDLHTVEKTAK